MLWEAWIFLIGIKSNKKWYSPKFDSTSPNLSNPSFLQEKPTIKSGSKESNIWNPQKSISRPQTFGD
jgi:hypothetical protein